MSRARCWNLRLNLDEFNAACWSLTSDEDRLLFFAGFLAGLNNGNLVVNQEVTSRVTGFALGQSMRLEAESFRAAKTAVGKLGGRPAKPRGSHEVNHVGTQDGTQSTIHNPLITINTIKPVKPKRAKRELQPVPEELLPFLEEILADWPRRSTEGGKTRDVTVLRPVDVWSRIQANRGTDDPKIPINAALHYLEGKPTSYVIGMDNFFGREKKYTKYVVED